MRAKVGLLLVGLLAGCVAPRLAPPPSAPARPAGPPLPRPVPPPQPASEDWRDVPLTPGRWTYATEPGGSAARFGGGAAQFVIRCTLAERTVTLSREGAATPPAPLFDVTTSAGRQSLRAEPLPDRPGATVVLRAADPLLDGIAFSRGRFVVAVTGAPRLVIPAWPEFARVVEDCRG